MKAYCENLNMPAQPFPVKIFINSTERQPMMVHPHWHEEMEILYYLRGSVSHFCRLFKRTTGMTFTAYLSLYRVNRAEEMLSSPCSITEIAYACGFNSPVSFIRSFKQYKNTTPSASRARLETDIKSLW